MTVESTQYKKLFQRNMIVKLMFKNTDRPKEII